MSLSSQSVQETSISAPTTEHKVRQIYWPYTGNQMAHLHSYRSPVSIPIGSLPTPFLRAATAAQIQPHLPSLKSENPSCSGINLYHTINLLHYSSTCQPLPIILFKTPLTFQTILRCLWQFLNHNTGPTRNPRKRRYHRVGRYYRSFFNTYAVFNDREFPLSPD